MSIAYCIYKLDGSGSFALPDLRGVFSSREKADAAIASSIKEEQEETNYPKEYRATSRELRERTSFFQQFWKVSEMTVDEFMPDGHDAFYSTD